MAIVTVEMEMEFGQMKHSEAEADAPPSKRFAFQKPDPMAGILSPDSESTVDTVSDSSSSGCDGATDTLSDTTDTLDSTSSCQDEEVEPEASPCDWRIVPALASVLQNLVRSDGSPTPFDGVQAPGITIKNYLERLQKYLRCSPECFVMALVYVDRLVRWYPDFALTNLNVHRLFSTALVVAAKMQDDFYYSNKYYSTVCGVARKELDELEVKLLHMLNWSCVVRSAEYTKFMDAVMMTTWEVV